MNNATPRTDAGCWFQVSGLRFQVSVLRLLSSAFRFQVSGFIPSLRSPLSVLSSLLLALCSLPLTALAEPAAEITTLSAWTNHSATALNIEALPNAFKVTDTLYRGAQPSAEGFKELQKLGIKTVVNLRAFHEDKDEVGDIGLPQERIPLITWRVNEEDVVRFLKIATDTNKLPLFVHCHYGSDRTGIMVAAYRMTVCDWKKEDAIDEMVNGGFGFHKTWENLITFLKNIDIESVKKKAGLK